jgi:hypothetical protein
MDVLVGSVGVGQSLNRFAFVSGNPVSWVDPFGLSGYPLFPGPASFPNTPNLEVCKYYDRIAVEQGCNYHSIAAQICRGEPTVWSWAANSLLEICSSFSKYPVGKVKNCVRTCLVAYDNYVRKNDPECGIKCQKGTCTKLECIDAYHHQCFENCGVSWRCYGGNYDDWLSPSLFYDAPGWWFDSPCENSYPTCK